MSLMHTTDEYPELLKLKEVTPMINQIRDFIDWLQNEKGIYLADYYSSDKLFRIKKPMAELFAEFFKLDLNKIEAERQQILDSYNG